MRSTFPGFPAAWTAKTDTHNRIAPIAIDKRGIIESIKAPMGADYTVSAACDQRAPPGATAPSSHSPDRATRFLKRVNEI
jgi:hypothetical protein